VGIGDRFATQRVTVGVLQLGAFVNLGHALNVRMQHYTATSVKHHAITIVSTISVSKMVNAH